MILPISNGGAFARRLGFAVPVTGIKTTGVVRCDQPRVIDLAVALHWKRRFWDCPSIYCTGIVEA